jgi:hypothetical protein
VCGKRPVIMARHFSFPWSPIIFSAIRSRGISSQLTMKERERERKKNRKEEYIGGSSFLLIYFHLFSIPFTIRIPFCEQKKHGTVSSDI